MPSVSRCSAGSTTSGSEVLSLADTGPEAFSLAGTCAGTAAAANGMPDRLSKQNYFGGGGEKIRDVA